MSFHEVRFPTRLSVGSTGGPERRTEIVTLANGHEQRNAAWAHSRRRYDAGMGLSSLDDLHEVLAFFEARMGPLHGFRWKDWIDWKSCAPSAAPAPTDQTLGVGDGAAVSFQLTKSYASDAQTYVRPIRKPVAGTVRVAVDGIERTDVSVDPTTGVVTFASPPAPGALVTAGFEFDVPVRFDTERIEISLTAMEAGEIPSIPVVEVRV
ncbi:DUF2460 domain-containing protein [Oceanicella actignis]|uniref:TIGR02217 family protein n=1 Tax=Oceanicella actignis TaxID=1189325 RepID=A0A1M7TZV1_9RHOB|nr:DUF2460 domain-containing protein [Oceanicella actignis]TYO85043.1 uncharacterized protein (TIGR02217 family) [Oceanicella actignis]SET83644.1 TIGR02217 family protein [Oceanicella actignis]SHN76244.1 TIGR02217 family protein [Oceanicella actignis]